MATGADPIDPALLGSIRAAALEESARLGATDASVRVEEISSQYVALRDAIARDHGGRYRSRSRVFGSSSRVGRVRRDG